jgi:CubicO group peptidase (beta-lactamase class C family)
MYRAARKITVFAIIVAVLTGVCDGNNNVTRRFASAKPDDGTAALAALVDLIVNEQLRKHHIPGAVVSVVKDGRIVLAKGYGYADLEMKTPVIPDRTIFRIGSMMKVFTATAVMQLGDRGRIRLRDDVNRYLRDLKVPATYVGPITFHNLLTHTSGLDEITPTFPTPSKSKLAMMGFFLFRTKSGAASSPYSLNP